MLKKWLIGFLMMNVLLLSIHLPTTAATAVQAPGGEVTSYEELAVALGGEAATQLKLASEDDPESKVSHLLILSDICLAAPVVITEGEYVIIGAGIEITASFTDGSFFEVGGDKEVTLILGSSQVQTDNENLILNGGKQTRKGSLLSIGNDATVAVFTGTVFCDSITEVAGGAIANDGTFVMYGGIIENCSSMGSGGAISSRGTVLLPEGSMIVGCSAEFGGALYNEGEATLAGTEIKECAATKGGAIFNANELEFHNSTVSNCRATQGGGLYNSGVAQLKSGQILSCQAENGEGGAIYNSGTLTQAGTYINENSAKNGGSLYNAGDAEIKDGQIYSGTATEAGGHVYNEPNAKLVVDGGSLGRGKAKLGGGIYNLGDLTVTGGGFHSNKADFGQAILNHGSLIFEKFPYVDDKNDVFIVIDEDNPHTIRIQSEMKADCIAVLTPGKQTADGYAYGYEEGVCLLMGDYVKDGYSHFKITPENGAEWLLNADGALVKPVPVYRQAWFYFALVGCFAVVVAVMVLSVRFFDKKRA